MSRVYDLHCHSDHSDGILSPEALVSRAKAQDVAVLALTDHDTTDGVVRAQAQAEIEGLELITGVEFSCDWNGRNIHVVGLNVDIESAPLKELIANQSRRREERAEIIAKKLHSAGIEGAYDGAKAIAGKGVLGRPHFAQFLVDSGACTSIEQSFKKYLGTGKIGDVKQIWPEMEEVLSAINDAGGAGVMAHPHKYKMTRTKLCAMVSDFCEMGGVAMEVISGKQHVNITRDLAKITQKFGLYASCGSDFHAPGMAWHELGQFPMLPPDLKPVWQRWE